MIATAVHGIATVFLAIGIALAAPFWIIGAWLNDRADDLEGGWRRGRKQNWLWRFARAWR